MLRKLSNFVLGLILTVMMTSSSAGPVVNLVTAGDFNNIMSLSKWSISSVPGGQVLGLMPVDIDGGGALGISNAFMAHSGASGGGSIFLRQTISELIAGNPYEFNANLASMPIFSNADGGVVRVWLDGSLITEYDFGSIVMGQPEYAVLSQELNPTITDSYLLSIEFSRQFQASIYSPTMFIDNIQLISKAATIPAPGALVLGSIGVIGVGFVRRKWSE